MFAKELFFFLHYKCFLPSISVALITISTLFVACALNAHPHTCPNIKTAAFPLLRLKEVGTQIATMESL